MKNLKKHIAEIIAKRNHLETTAVDVLYVHHNDAANHYRVTVKNTWIEEGSETEIVTFNDILIHLCNKIEELSN